MAAARLKTIGYTNATICSISPYDPFDRKTNSDMVYQYRVIYKYVYVRRTTYQIAKALPHHIGLRARNVSYPLSVLFFSQRYWERGSILNIRGDQKEQKKKLGFRWTTVMLTVMRILQYNRI